MKKENNIIIFVIIILIIALIIGVVFINYDKKVTPETNDSAWVSDSSDTITNISLFNENIKLTIKAKNPQYYSGQDILILYDIVNMDNKSINIPGDVYNGIEIKDAGNRIVNYTGSDGKIIFIKDSITLLPLGKINSNFSIGWNDYNFLQLGSPGEGYYNTINAYIEDIRSNTIVIRIFKR